MTDQKQHQSGLPTPVMVLRSEKYEQQELAKEMAARNADPLNEAKRPGGFFLNADGTPVDANGIEIPEEELSGDEKKAVSEQKKLTKEGQQADLDAAKEQQRLQIEAAKVQRKADEANQKATQTAVEANWAKTRASAPPARTKK
jgi:hypothetical protein